MLAIICIFILAAFGKDSLNKTDALFPLMSLGFLELFVELIVSIAIIR